MEYAKLSKEELLKELDALKAEYKGYEEAGLQLNMARGKPAPNQLDLAMPMMDVLNSKSNMIDSKGNDTRNYAPMDGIYEAKVLMAEIIECKPEEIIVMGNASLNIMYDTVARSMIHGVNGSTPWCKLDKVKWLCPVPGYDRHFAITESFGIEMINIPMSVDGPDMDMVEKLVAEDEAIKGIWCVPKYSNPMGNTYSDEVVKRMAALKPAAKDFRIFWDNAYCIHHIYEEADRQDKLLNIIDECAAAGNPDMVYEFASTSKVTFAGGGISAVATSPANLEWIKKSMTIQTIGYDKVNMLRHVAFLKDRAGTDAHMMKHARILRPKFELVMNMLGGEIVSRGIGEYVAPRGGYFVCFSSNPGCAKRIIELAKNAGVVMTGAGAPFPYKKDPEDRVIRIAPSYPDLDELKKAMEVFICCVKIASIEKMIEA